VAAPGDIDSCRPSAAVDPVDNATDASILPEDVAGVIVAMHETFAVGMGRTLDDLDRFLPRLGLRRPARDSKCHPIVVAAILPAKSARLHPMNLRGRLGEPAEPQRLVHWLDHYPARQLRGARPR